MDKITFSDVIADLRDAAIDIYPESYVMRAVMITQALLEAGYIADVKGSALAREDNNLFGIKGRGTAGSVTRTTKEFINGKMVTVRDTFAKYATVADCFEAHKVFLEKPRYAKVLKANSPEEAFIKLQEAGYATSPTYAKDLTSVYTRYVR